MARTIAEIQQEMIDAKNAETSLADLTSTSATAIWNLIFYICAVSIKTIEDLFVVQKQDVEDRRVEIPVGVTRWYGAESLVFQFGDELIFENERLDYPVIDETKQIIDLAAADVVNGIVIIKVAKLVSGVATPLSASELSAFQEYWNQKRFAGTSIQIISTDADLLKAFYNITYDPQVLAPDGSLLTDSAVFPVEDAINNFLQSFQGEDFAGDMKVMRLTDAIQLADGVVNAVATDVQGKPTGGTYVDILANAQQIYSSNAGYIKIDPLFPLSTTLTYIAG